MKGDCTGRLEQWSSAIHLGRQAACLPLSPKLADPEVERVIHAICTLTPYTRSSRP
jgi:dTDP-4-amino-4,6-dideoxygalactose transaminase